MFFSISTVLLSAFSVTWAEESTQISSTIVPYMSDDIVLQAMHHELYRSFEWLQNQDIPPYWIELAVTEIENQEIIASNGALQSNEKEAERVLDIDLRVGNYQLDNTHPMIDGGFFGDEKTHFADNMPISNNSYLLRKYMWNTMDEAYRTSVRRLLKIETNADIKTEMEDKSGDFSPSTSVIHLDPIEKNTVDMGIWKNVLKECSVEFLKNADIIDSSVGLDVINTTRWIANTDGSIIREYRPHARLWVMAYTLAEDGMELTTYEYQDVRDITTLHNGSGCVSLVQTASDNLSLLRNAPLVDPYVGPAILRGKATAVFFHEIVGHRAEGHRQKDEDEGQTLTDKVGQPIFPAFISIVDDPTQAQFQQEDLNGYYQYDDEGVVAQPVTIVENGILRGFLMGRSPIENFDTSNGHGRRSAGRAPVSRQGNLFISSNKSVGYDALKKALLHEIQTQNKPFGLIFDDISGGFTFTGRSTPNSYVVKPVTVWKIYPDGREEMVRGVDMIGTPLLTFSQIMLASDAYQVFNGVCGAESGWVPVSAIAPDILLKEVEVQRRSKDHDLPPLLTPPTK